MHFQLQTSISIIAALCATGQVLAQKWPIVFKGRMSKGSTPATFDSTASLFDSKNVKGANLTWAQIIQLPNTTISLFDTNITTISTLITLFDASIFAPSATNIQTGSRRAELLLSSNNGSDSSTLGQKIVRFLIMKDTKRPLNMSHEYQLFFLESEDFGTNQVVLKTGTISGITQNSTNNLVMVGNDNTQIGTPFSTPFTEGRHNFEVVMDFDRKFVLPFPLSFRAPFALSTPPNSKNSTTQILHATDTTTPLSTVTTPITNDISGQGQYHFGMLKKPTGENLTDVTEQWFQESGIDEGVVWGGVFVEDSAVGGGVGCEFGAVIVRWEG
ncbi:hypothetical protein G7Y89_g10940 [Cudoniella acicularis]|uniref:Glycoside hydrolase 131 catalytic N-terminal domain-containing protein n=1 Tax=Cudoniella acicularis TaxID=354080 RepID=A0A8H4REL1_9HELO|nr:hypothetical protein G7Y89_g10940 [Cudoniella acicularis]